MKINHLFIAVVAIVVAFTAQKISNSMQQITSKVNVWDTYVTKKDGQIMHFDIIAPAEVKDTNQIYDYGRAYLARKGQQGQALSSEQCRLCHIEQLKPEWEASIIERGYFIIEMEGCN